jgi:hypothetical protein
MTTPAGNQPAEPSKEAREWVTADRNRRNGWPLEWPVKLSGRGSGSMRFVVRAYDAGAAAALARVRAEIERRIKVHEDGPDNEWESASWDALDLLLAFLDGEQGKRE